MSDDPVVKSGRKNSLLRKIAGSTLMVYGGVTLVGSLFVGLGFLINDISTAHVNPIGLLEALLFTLVGFVPGYFLFVRGRQLYRSFAVEKAWSLLMVIGVVTLGYYGLYRADRWFNATKAYVTIQNRTGMPVQIIKLRYNAETLLENKKLEVYSTYGRQTFFEFYPEPKNPEIILAYKRLADASIKSHVLNVGLCEFTQCYYDIIIREQSVEIYDPMKRVLLVRVRSQPQQVGQ